MLLRLERIDDVVEHAETLVVHRRLLQSDGTFDRGFDRRVRWRGSMGGFDGGVRWTGSMEGFDGRFDVRFSSTTADCCRARVQPNTAKDKNGAAAPDGDPPKKNKKISSRSIDACASVHACTRTRVAWRVRQWFTKCRSALWLGRSPWDIRWSARWNVRWNIR